MEHHPLKILCFDGGGIRGLSALLILDEIMESLQVEFGWPEPPLPCETFDMICGTSTGGLIALMLGRLRMSVKDAIQCYCKFAEDVFGSPPSYLIRLVKGLQGKAMYDASKLERCIKAVCREYGGREDAPLGDPQDRNKNFCRVFVVTVTRSYADAIPKLFRSYTSDMKSPDRCAIWEAARATTAATLFFDPMEVGRPPQTLIDGGFSGANNPSKLALMEVHTLFPERPIGFFLSLGTGVGNVVSVSRGLAGIARACARLITDCEVVAHEVGREFSEYSQKNQQENPYFRLSVSQGVGNIRLDEWEEKESLVGITKAYMRSGEKISRLKQFVNILSPMKEEVKGDDRGGEEEMEEEMEEMETLR